MNTSASGLKTISQQHPAMNSPPKVKVNITGKKKPDKKPGSGNMAETAGAAGGIKVVQADVNANTLAPVTSRYVNPRYTDTSESGAACTSVNHYTVQSVAFLKAFYHKKKHEYMGSDTAFKKTGGRENISLLRG